ncbi:MAG: bifunctional metallophosphatase/5'-nucleotidase [Bacteroidaceae bacterium]|nr:bifunctional metallophosphatase/5'-nucleotidase [Bacteroidaceae bacterium]
METRKINIIYTTDVHGNYFPFDFRRNRWGKGSLQRVHAFVAQQVKRFSGSTILIDGGDMLQGEPASYYFNFIRPTERHKVADICNFIGYDVAVIGNHDIETGHDIFNKFINNCNFPVLGANAINIETEQPYFEPYTMLYRSGVKIAVIGFITPAIPHWVPQRMWEGLRFDDIRESAQKWISIVKEQEDPDFIIGLLHSGMDEGIVTPEYHENAVRETVSSVDGFDLVLYGHDHHSNMEEIESPSGKSVLCVNAGSYANSVAEIKLKFSLNDDKKVVKHDIDAQIKYIGTISNSHSTEFKRHFMKDFKEVKAYASQLVGRFTAGVNISDAYFGPSAYIDFIQHLLLQASGADISLMAPLFFNASIKAGDIHVSDLFNLYRFEDCIYTLRLTGLEIKNYLEMSYANWTNQMHSIDDSLLLLSPMKSNPERLGFTNFIFNFDSAAGIIYEVDVTRPAGEKITIKQMADGRPFSLNGTYLVAMTAYRANGGGELLTKGAELTKDEIKQRIVKFSEHDIRYYIMNYLQQHHDVEPRPLNHWRFVPEEWVKAAEQRDRQLLFNKPSTSDAKTDEDEEDA